MQLQHVASPYLVTGKLLILPTNISDNTIQKIFQLINTEHQETSTSH